MELSLLEGALEELARRGVARGHTLAPDDHEGETRLQLAQLVELGYLAPCEPCVATRLVGGLAKLSASVAAVVLSSQVAHRHLGLRPPPPDSHLAATLFAAPLAGKPELLLTGGRLHGVARSVVGGGLCTHLVLRALAEDGSTPMLLIEARESEVTGTAPHLGLRGAACVDFRLERERQDGFELLAPPDRTANPASATSRGIAALWLALLTQHRKEAEAYAAERIQGQKPIAQHPQLTALIGLMTTAVALADACQSSRDGRPELLPLASHQARLAADAGLQIFGGLGYITKCPIVTLYRDIYTASLFRP